MATRNEIYLCEKCGNLVEVLDGGPGKMSCCDIEMALMEEKTSDKGLEKHVPVIEEKDGGALVKVGDVPHPMEDEHYIMMVEILDGDDSCKKFLEPGQDPEAFFDCADAKKVSAREYCNIHGLWRA